MILLVRVFVVVKANADDAKSNIARESSFGAFRSTDFGREENTASSSLSSSSMFASIFQRLVRPCLRLCIHSVLR